MGKWWKGPWRVDRDVLIDRWTVVEEGGSVVASFDVEGDFEEPINLANAELCAAAPDLAEALADLIERIEAWETAVRKVIGGREVEHGMDLSAARAALAKARGEA